MGEQAVNVFGEILDNSSKIIIEIKNEVYKLLGINTQNQQLVQYVKESLEKFAFNVVENQFLEQIKNIVFEEINKSDYKLKNNENVDYEIFTNNMIERLRQVKLGNIYLDDDLKALSSNIVDKFPYSNITKEQLYSHFSSKKEKIVNMINMNNQDIIDVLIKFTPQLANELSNKRETNQNVISTPLEEQSTVKNELSKEQLLIRCKQKLDEVNIMFKNGGNAKSEIAKGFRQLSKFIENLNDSSFAQDVLDRYTKQQEETQESIYDNIIYENVPLLKGIYEKYNSLLVKSPNKEQGSNLEKVVAKPVSIQEQSYERIENQKQEPKKEKTYNERKQELINHFINHTVWVFANEIKQSYPYPYDLSYADISQYKDALRPQLNIPAYPVSDEEFDEIISIINNRLKEFVSQLILDDEKKRNELLNNTSTNSKSSPTFYVDGFEEQKKEQNTETPSTEQIKKQEEQSLNSTQQTLETQEKKKKDNLVQQIINAMNKSGEFAFGDISFDERLYKINDIRNKLNNKSIEDLQTILSTGAKFNTRRSHK